MGDGGVDGWVNCQPGCKRVTISAQFKEIRMESEGLIAPQYVVTDC